MTKVGGWLTRGKGLVEGIVCVLGYWAPWNAALHLDGAGPNAHVWGVAAAALAKAGVMGIGTGFAAVLGVGIALAALAAGLRTFGRGGSAAVGTGLHVAALGLLMPLSGAVFALVVVAALEWWLRARASDGGSRGPAWRAALREVYVWGVAGSFAVAGWRYDAGLLVRCVVVSAGVGLVVRGMLPRSEAGAEG